MKNSLKALLVSLSLAVLPVWSHDASAALVVDPASGYLIPDYFGNPNWANSPPLRKFVDSLPPLGCTTPTPLGQCIPVAVADPDAFPAPPSDYYEIAVVEYEQQMHSDLPPTRLRGYVQLETAANSGVSSHFPLRYVGGGPILDTGGNPVFAVLKPQYLGPIIVARKDRPVRVKFVNYLPTGQGGELFIPVDTSIMGAGMGRKTASGVDCMDPADPLYDPNNPLTACVDFTENRATLHLHGGLSPWISDGTPHQWITPAGEATVYLKGDSVQNVPDMPNPGPGAQTFYWTNQQSARLMFYHDHSWGITRLNVYAGEAAVYLITDQTEQDLITAGTIPADQIPLIIQDKTFVDAATIGATDPTWAWGTAPGKPAAVPRTGDLWWPHVYMPAQNPYDAGGANPFGRWHYGPWFFPPTLNIAFPPVANPYFDCWLADAAKPFPYNVDGPCTQPWQPPEMPGTPNPSWGAEAFMDTPLVNGTAYPTLDLQPRPYRFRILNAAHDRFFNLQFYVADPVVRSADNRGLTEVRMVPAAATPGFPETWPTDGRPGGVPDPATAGPAWIQIGTEGGFLPAPVLLENTPINWNTDVTTFNAGNVNQGTMILGPAERSDVIVDFSQYAGKTLILYNDSPAPYPALDPHYDYFTGAEDLTDIGGSAGTPVGFGPNTRTIMQIRVSGSGGVAPVNDFSPTLLTNLENAFRSTGSTAGGNFVPGVFAKSQNPVIVAQSAYDTAYNKTFPTAFPYWGVSRIGDESVSFVTTDQVPVNNYFMQSKAIQDEMGEVFDEFGRMSAKLGLELAVTVAGVKTFMLQNYVDPVTEIVLDGEPQIWKITQNGVDTHPVHFHLFDVQILNRVGWDGFIRPPDPNELGWKDTVRISPLEDTIVALRPKAPKNLPFSLPASSRLLNPSLPPGSSLGFTQIDPVTGLLVDPPITNQVTNFFAEYVWHCHILSHEEADMMRTIILHEPGAAPNVPGAFAVATPLQQNVLLWTDTQFRTLPVPPTPDTDDYNRATGFKVLRCESPCTPASADLIATMPILSTTPVGDTLTYEFQSYTDKNVIPSSTYTYAVVAYNSFGDSAATPPVTVLTSSWQPATGVTLTPEFASPHAAPVKFNAQATFSAAPPVPTGQYRFSFDGAVVQDYSYAKSWTVPSGTALGPHTVAVDVRTFLTSPTPDPGATAAVPFTLISIPEAPTGVTATTDLTVATVSFTAPAADGGSAVTSYTATSVPGGQTGAIAAPFTLPLRIAVPGLTNGTSYFFTVTATNAAGTGPASAPSNAVPAGATAPAAPTIGTATPANGQVSVSFTAPLFDGGSPITSYTATSNPGGITALGPGTPIGPITVTGLANGTAYTFTVTAINAAATGPASAATSPVTPFTVPDQPRLVSAAATPLNAQATVSFSPPAFDGGSTIAGYTVLPSPAGGADDDAGSTALTHLITGLANGVSYTFTVTAANGAGTGLPSAPSNRVTPYTVPDAPPAPVATTAFSTKATVIITAPGFDGGSAITGYTVASLPPGGVDVNAGTTALGHAITGLTDGISYAFKVTATNAAGPGSASPASNPVTPFKSVPDAPIIGAAFANSGQVSVNFAAPAYDGGSPIISYTATADRGGFSISGPASPLVVTGLANFSAYTFSVTATNALGTGPASAASAAVVPDNPPTDIALSKTILVDVPPVGTTLGLPLGTLSTTDADAGETFVYSLVPGSGDADNASFRIAGNEIQTAAVLDYSMQNAYRIRVRSRDQGGAGYWTEKIFAIMLAPAAVNDFDGDGRSDIGCYYPPGGNWYEFRSTDGFWSTAFGYEGTIPITGDFDGDGKTDIGCYHPESGHWYVMKSQEGFWQSSFGYSGTIPIAGDFDADGRDDIGVYDPRNGKWFLSMSTEGFRETAVGFAGTPVVGDFDGDGRKDVGVYSEVGGNWYLFKSTEGFWETTFGYKGTLPVVGDFDGDGRDDIGCYDPAGGNWYIFKSTEGFWQTTFGYAGTEPVVGDFDGDGRADIGCYYPSGGNWYLFKSTDGFWQTRFGYEGTIPLGGMTRRR